VTRKTPRNLSFVRWIERTIRLPVGLSAEPGRIAVPPYFREVAGAMVDPRTERITLMKSARLGFSTLLTSLIARHMTEDPAPVLVVLPAELDARNYVVDIESIFDCSPALQGKLPTPATAGRASRNTLLFRRGTNGASLRLVGATAPRNLRAVTAKILLIDEADALIDTAEGAAISLAEARTLSFRDRKIVVGGTPLAEDISHIAASYAASTMEVFEVPCLSCGAFSEIEWPRIEWPEGRPELAAWRCPHCETLLTEASKYEIAKEGRWRAQSPSAGPEHRGFRISSLVSSLPAASWGKLAAEYERVKDDDDRLKVFTNVVLGLPWKEIAEELDEGELARRAEGFDLDHVPAEVLAITVGADVQDDRIEISALGHTRDGAVLVLGHVTIWGSPIDDDTLAELDKVLRQRFRHPAGGALKIDAAVIDAGDGGHYDAIMRFANTRMSRRVLAGKGAAGFARPAIQSSKTKKGRLFIVGVDGLKTQIINRLARGRSIRFSHALDAAYFEQLAGERRVVRMARGRPVARFERRPGVKRVEALDCLVYGLAAKAALQLGEAAFDQREQDLQTPAPAKPAPAPVGRSQWLARQHRSGFDDSGWRR
jgi:phage terminase large subunit GpA-like protein